MADDVSNSEYQILWETRSPSELTPGDYFKGIDIEGRLVEGTVDATPYPLKDMSQGNWYFFYRPHPGLTTTVITTLEVEVAVVRKKQSEG